jgi:hypothetical protein
MIRMCSVCQPIGLDIVAQSFIHNVTSVSIEGRPVSWVHDVKVMDGMESLAEP